MKQLDHLLKVVIVKGVKCLLAFLVLVNINSCVSSEQTDNAFEVEFIKRNVDCMVRGNSLHFALIMKNSRPSETKRRVNLVGSRFIDSVQVIREILRVDYENDTYYDNRKIEGLKKRIQMQEINSIFSSSKEDVFRKLLLEMEVHKIKNVHSVLVASEFENLVNVYLEKLEVWF